MATSNTETSTSIDSVASGLVPSLMSAVIISNSDSGPVVLNMPISLNVPLPEDAYDLADVVSEGSDGFGNGYEGRRKKTDWHQGQRDKATWVATQLLHARSEPEARDNLNEYLRHNRRLPPSLGWVPQEYIDWIISGAKPAKPIRDTVGKRLAHRSRGPIPMLPRGQGTISASDFEANTPTDLQSQSEYSPQELRLLGRLDAAGVGYRLGFEIMEKYGIKTVEKGLAAYSALAGWMPSGNGQREVAYKAFARIVEMEYGAEQASLFCKALQADSPAGDRNRVIELGTVLINSPKAVAEKFAGTFRGFTPQVLERYRFMFETALDNYAGTYKTLSRLFPEANENKIAVAAIQSMLQR